jgi:hypothetical protein
MSEGITSENYSRKSSEEMIKADDLLKILENVKADIPKIIEKSMANKAQPQEEAMKQLSQSKQDLAKILNYMVEMIEQIKSSPQQFVEKMKENQNDVRKTFDQLTVDAQNNFKKVIGEMEMENPALDMLSRFDPNALREKMIERIQKELGENSKSYRQL